MRCSALVTSSSAWYAVSIGSLKSTVASLDGRAQVTGFYVAGDLVGWDGIHTGRHSFNMVALEDTEVRVLPYGQLESAARLLPALHTDLHKTMSREIVRDHEMMLLLGSMRAEQRLAAFLLNLAQRLKTVGRVNSGFTLQMTRADIGSFLGLKLETVSRGFSRLARRGLIELNCRQVRIIIRLGCAVCSRQHRRASQVVNLSRISGCLAHVASSDGLIYIN